MRKIAVIFLFIGVAAGAAFAQVGVKKKRIPPYEYGLAVIDNHSSKTGIAPVEFDHWNHRSRFTCRLCHVDIGFAMKIGGSQIKAADNVRGYFCGACHNGKMEFDGKKLFAACASDFSKDDVRGRCERCHVKGKNAKKEDAFYKLADRLPRERFGNGVNWEKAEEEGLIKPINFIEGISLRQNTMSMQKELSLGSKVEGIPDIIFSHKKHTVWNGCEVCHPDLFVGTKKGLTKYTMPENFEGKFCGACHGTVAFPLLDCQRCHVKTVQ
jgi:c(7)-type cytochrome triheme protein